MKDRKDSWSLDDDQILAEIVLRHVREGSTQLKAFEEASERLERTSSACGFRWNSEVRKQFEEALKQAKIGKGSKKKVELGINDSTGKDITDEVMDDPPVIVSSTREDVIAQFDPMATLDLVKNYIAHLEAENKLLIEENEKLKANKPSEDLSQLIAILDRARNIITEKTMNHAI